jgi:hypothetical protein
MYNLIPADTGIAIDGADNTTPMVSRKGKQTQSSYANLGKKEPKTHENKLTIEEEEVNENRDV